MGKGRTVTTAVVIGIIVLTWVLFGWNMYEAWRLWRR